MVARMTRRSGQLMRSSGSCFGWLCAASPAAQCRKPPSCRNRRCHVRLMESLWHNADTPSVRLQTNPTFNVVASKTGYLNEELILTKESPGFQDNQLNIVLAKTKPTSHHHVRCRQQLAAGAVDPSCHRRGLAKNRDSVTTLSESGND